LGIAKGFAASVWIAALTATAAQADACRDEVAALFDGGPLDPRTVSPRVITAVLVAADGTVTPQYEATIETVTRSMNHINGMYILMDGTRSFMGDGPDGPWTETGNSMPADGAARSLAQAQSMQRNLSDTECLGQGDLGGQTVVAYRYRTRVDPTPEGSWWGALYTTYIDPVTGLMVRQDGAERIASWAETPSTDTEVLTIRHDPAIRLAVPD
jgi:hypothetical protein